MSTQAVKSLVDRHRIKLSPALGESFRMALANVGADEGTLWLLEENEEMLVPVWNSGPNADAFVGRHRQPLTAGLISLVCVTGQALCENSVYKNAQQDPTLDRKLGVFTCSMIAVPLTRDGAVCGVVSCVKLKVGMDAPDPPPFTAADLARVADAVATLPWEGGTE